VFLPPNGVLSTDFVLKSENCGLLSKEGKLKSKESETKSLEFAPVGLMNEGF
jgi:hypothetical protein